MGRTLAATVAVEHPDTHERFTFARGSELPDWAAGLVTNPAAFATEPATPSDSVQAILETVSGDPDRAVVYLEAERAKGDGARKSLVERLEAIVAGE